MNSEIEISQLKNRIEQYPGFADLYNKLAIHLTHKGFYADAKKALDSALEVNPRYVEALCNMAAIAIEEQSFGLANKYLETAEELDPNYHWLFFLKGQLHWKQNNHEEAEQFLRETIRQKPDFAPAYADLGLLYYEQGKIEEGDKCLMKSATMKTPDEFQDRKKDFLGPVLSRKATMVSYMGQKVLADNLHHSAIQANPKFPDLYNAYAEFLLAENRAEEAQKILREALALNPKYQRAILNFTYAYIQLGELEKAREAKGKLYHDMFQIEIQEIEEMIGFLQEKNDE